MNKRALISVTNKDGIAEFGRDLANLGWEIISSGGTHTLLSEKGVPCTPVDKITGFPELLGGRLKTLHPLIHGGILFDRSNLRHQQEVAEYGIGAIDMVVVNLYDFAGKPSIEQIDIGGPTLIRGAAKNHLHVIVIVDPADYPRIIEALRKGNLVPMEMQTLAAKAFRSTAKYDDMIASHFEQETRAGHEIAIGPH